MNTIKYILDFLFICSLLLLIFDFLKPKDWEKISKEINQQAAKANEHIIISKQTFDYFMLYANTRDEQRLFDFIDALEKDQVVTKIFDQRIVKHLRIIK